MKRYCMIIGEEVEENMSENVDEDQGTWGGSSKDPE